MTALSFWGCVEVDACSRDFDYQDYVDFHTKTGCVGAKLSEACYKHIWNIFHTAMEEAIEFHPDPDVDSM